MGQIQSLAELLSFLKRRWLMIAVITAVGFVSSYFVAAQRKPVYEGVAVIRVEAPRVNAEDPSQAAMSTSAAPILQGIEQRLTTRESLSAVIERHRLFAGMPAWSMDEKVSVLRGMIRFEGIDSAAGQGFGAGRNLAAIMVYAQDGDAEMAARLANDFAQGILDQSSAGQLEMAAENFAFFQEEEARLWGQMAQLEQEVARFKNENADSLPGLQEAVRVELTALDTALRESAQEMAALEGQIQALESQENLRQTDLRQLVDWKAAVAVIQSQIDQSLARRERTTAVLARLPEVERVLSGYERQHKQLQAEYEQVTGRMAVAQTNLRLTERGQDERFTLLERAVRPEYSSVGGRKKLVMAGVAAAFCAGLGLAFILDLAKPVVRTSAQMQRQLGIRPVVTIPSLAPRQRASLLRDLPRLIEDPMKLAINLPRPALIAMCLGLCGIMTAILV